MTIIEALKSGKRFKRPHFKDWYTSDWSGGGFSCESILADDWEIEYPKLKAWLCRCDYSRTPEVYFTRFSSGEESRGSDWIRAPWLDEP